MSESYIKHTNTCKKFALSDQGDVITGREYTPHKIYHGKKIDGQMSFGDYERKVKNENIGICKRTH